MLAVEKWAKNKPKEFALLAQKLALSAESMCQMAEYFYDTGPYAKILTFPSLPEWYGYYKKHREISTFLTDVLSDFFPSKASVFSQMAKNLQPSSTSKDEKSEELTKLVDEHAQDIYRLLFSESIAEYSAEDFTVEEQGKMVMIFKNPRFNFFVNVCLICNGFYGQEPGLLLRKARLGDVDALEKILRLDARMISEPRIAQQVFNLHSKGKRTKYLRVLGCLGKKPKLKFTLQKIKCVKSGQISAFAEQIGFKITAPDIRALFDALSKDSGRGMVDNDLPLCDEAFSKAVQRERAFWIGKYAPDKS
ncbi:MAG: hypothetical protein IH613_10895 [Desulfuromonadales bacterium]|nr:hypothetical protein [Desulfuromonadales bacterium]